MKINLRLRFISTTYKRFSSLFLLLCSLLSFSRASAMAEYDVYDPNLTVLNTPYPTLTPILATPTYFNPLSTLDASCPSGSPIGWGTVTPSVDWLYSCSQCLPTGTAQNFYTSTVGPTHTPVVSDTPSPVCVTPSGGGEEFCTTPTIVVTPTVFVTPSVTGTPFVDYTGIVWDQSSCVASNGTIECDYPNPKLLHFVYSGNWLPYSSDFYFKTVDTLSRAADITATFYFSVHTQGTVDSGTPAQCFYAWYIGAGGCGSLSDTITGNYNRTIWGVTGSNEYFSDTFDPNHWGSRTMEGWVSVDAPYDPDITPTPTVTTTPSSCSSSSYCGCVSDKPVENLFSFGGSGRPVRQQCMTTPEISFSSAIDVIDFIFPIVTPIGTYLKTLLPEFVIDPITICIRERDYSLYLFGIRMPIEFILGLIIFLAGIRFWVPIAGSGASVLGSTPSPSASEEHSRSHGHDPFGDYGQKR